MARQYKPKAPFRVKMRVLIPTSEKVKGSVKKVFTDPEASPYFYGSFRTFGGTDTTVDDLLVVQDTGTIDTWYRPDIKSNCRIYIENTGETYEILGDPENINMANQYLRIRVRKIGGAV